MKTTILSIACVVALCLTTSPVRAEETVAHSPSPRPENARMIKTEEIKQKIDEKKMEFKDAAIARMQNETGKRSELLAKECSRVSENATTLIGKIQERVDRAKIEGRDVQTTIDALAKAKSDLASGKSLCDQAVAKFDAIPTDSWANSSAAITEARQLARQSKEKFMLMRKDLGDAIKAIKGIGSGHTEPSAKPSAEPHSEN